MHTVVDYHAYVVVILHYCGGYFALMWWIITTVVDNYSFGVWVIMRTEMDYHACVLGYYASTNTHHTSIIINHTSIIIHHSSAKSPPHIIHHSRVYWFASGIKYT